MTMRLSLVVPWLILIVGCGPTPQTQSGIGDAAAPVLLGLHEGAIHVLTDDVDSDGRTDLVFTSHGGNYSQVYFQREGRRFEAGPKGKAVGFHPNDLIRLPGPEQLYLVCGEGDKQLHVLRIDDKGKFSLAASMSLNDPRSATPFVWPGWPRSLALSHYAGKMVTLLQDFDPLTATAQRQFSLVPDAAEQRAGTIEAADLDGDGIVELYFTMTEANELWRLRYPGTDGEPKPERIAYFGEKNYASRFVSFMDLDNDGDSDILVPLETGQRFEVLLNDGAGGFERGAPINFGYPEGPYSLATGVDRDGTRLLAAGADRAFGLYRFTPQLGYQSPGAYESVLFHIDKDFPAHIVMEDLDGDGWLDLAVARGGKRGTPSGMVIFGPLWPAFQAESKRAPILTKDN